MAVLVTVASTTGLLRYEEHIDKFIGVIATVWATFVAAMLDLNKDNQ